MKKSCVCLYNDGKSQLNCFSGHIMNRLMHCVQHCVGDLLSPSPVRKKSITWSGSDEGKIELHSLDRDLRLALTNFLYYTRN